MKALLITIKGGEEAASQEIKELLGMEGKTEEEAVEFEFKKYEELFKLCYFSQSALRILLLDKPENWLKKGATFKVISENTEKEAETGAEINKKNEYKVDLENPEITFFQHKKHLGIDLTGDISKRSFRVFTHKHSLKGTTAFILLKEAGYTGKESLLDPFAKDGTIILEACHYATKRPVRFYDREKFPLLKLFKSFKFEDFFSSFKEKEPEKDIYAVSSDARDLQATRKNAKIAGVKSFKASRIDMDWLDTKFNENEAELLVTYPPKLEPKQLKEFYYRIAYIARKIVLLVDIDFNYEDDLLKIEKEKIIQTGKTEKKIVWLKKLKYT